MHLVSSRFIETIDIFRYIEPIPLLSCFGRMIAVAACNDPVAANYPQDWLGILWRRLLPLGRGTSANQPDRGDQTQIVIDAPRLQQKLTYLSRRPGSHRSLS
jgi:hypothetical protein